MSKLKEKTRCPGVNFKNPEYIKYHDKEWGRPVCRDQKHFECPVLEGAQVDDHSSDCFCH